MAAEVATTCTEDFSVLSSGFPNVLGGAYKCVLSADIETREDSRKYPAFYFCSSQPLFVKTEDINRIRDAWEAYVESEKDWQVTSEFESIADDACIEFCNSHGLIPVLRKCLNQACEIFSNRRSIKAELSHFEDDFSEEDGHVVIRLEVASDAETTSREYNAWVNWVVDSIKHKNIGLLTLTIRRV